MGIYFDLSFGWILILLILYVPYLFLFWKRKSYKSKKEIKGQLFFGLTAFFVAAIFELIGISTKLWTYIPNNWPIALWVAYFGAGLWGYQIVKKIEESV